jgi:hypothetical protein
MRWFSTIRPLSFFISVCLVAVYFTLQSLAVQTHVGVNTTSPFSHDAFDEVLNHYVAPNGFVDFAQLKLDSRLFNLYLKRLADVSPDTHPQLFPQWQHRAAYWLNAYNALAIRYTLDHYPTDKAYLIPTELVAKYRRYTLGGAFYQLPEIEQRLQELQAHSPIPFKYATSTLRLNGMPLPQYAYTPALLEVQLQAQQQRTDLLSQLRENPHGVCNTWLLTRPIERINALNALPNSLYFPPKAIQTISINYLKDEKPIFEFCRNLGAAPLPPSYLLADVWQIRSPHDSP